MNDRMQLFVVGRRTDDGQYHFFFSGKRTNVALYGNTDNTLASFYHPTAN